jgi:OOP family OmpA-OmpF porin
MDNFHNILVTSSAFALLSISNVQAEWYAGSNASQQSVIPYPSSLANSDFYTSDILTYKESKKAQDNSVSLFGGYKTAQNFSLQLEYQNDLSFGIDDMFAGSSLWFPETEAQNFESNGLFLSGISSYPINDNGALYMKGGLFNWEVDSNYDESSSSYLGQSRGTDLFYGLGANYDLNARFGVSAEWERYQMEKSDIDYLSTKLKFKF